MQDWLGGVTGLGDGLGVGLGLAFELLEEFDFDDLLMDLEGLLLLLFDLADLPPTLLLDFDFRLEVFDLGFFLRL